MSASPTPTNIIEDDTTDNAILEDSSIADIQYNNMEEPTSEVNVLLKHFCNYFRAMKKASPVTHEILENMLRDKDFAYEFLGGFEYLHNKQLLLNYFLKNVLKFVQLVWNICFKKVQSADECVSAEHDRSTGAFNEKTVAVENLSKDSNDAMHSLRKSDIVLLIEDLIGFIEGKTLQELFVAPLTQKVLERMLTDKELAQRILNKMPYLQHKPSLRAYFQKNIAIFVHIMNGEKNLDKLIKAPVRRHICENTKKYSENVEQILYEKFMKMSTLSVASHLLQTAQPVANRNYINASSTAAEDLGDCTETNFENKVGDVNNNKNAAENFTNDLPTSRHELGLEMLNSIGFTDQNENLRALNETNSIAEAALRLLDMHKEAYN